MTLDPAFLTTPIAHRGYHDAKEGRIENSASAARAAIGAGYGIEIDLQLSQDGQSMVFHDYSLKRLTGRDGTVQTTHSDDLRATCLTGSRDTIPTLTEFLELVAGRVPLLIELKDQDGAMGPNVGTLEEATVQALSGYKGPVALMSFNPHSVAKLGELAPGIPRGLTTESWSDLHAGLIPRPRRDTLLAIADYDRVGACFISHEAADLSRPRVRELREKGAHILCWTIRSTEDEVEARKIADNITFEGYAALHPAQNSYA